MNPQDNVYTWSQQEELDILGYLHVISDEETAV